MTSVRFVRSMHARHAGLCLRPDARQSAPWLGPQRLDVASDAPALEGMLADGSCWPLADDALVRTLAAGGPGLEEEGCDSFFAGVLLPASPAAASSTDTARPGGGALAPRLRLATVDGCCCCCC